MAMCGSTSVAFDERTLSCLLMRQARLGERLLIRFGDRSLTYRQAPRFAAQWAALLTQGGVVRGSRVAVMCDNSFELMGLWLGAAWLGAVFAPINISARGMGLKHVLETIDPAVLVVKADYEERVNASGANPGSLKTRWRLEEMAELPSNGLPEPADSHPGDPLVVLFTSGTTGPSKGVVCPHAQFYWWGVLNARSLGIVASDVIYTVLPQFHTNALNTFWQALVTGGTYAFGTRFSVSRYFEELKQTGATVTHLLGAMTTMLLSRPRSDADTAHAVRVALSGGTKAETAAAFTRRFGIRTVDGYGSTEAGLVFSTTNGDAPLGTMGRAFDEYEVAVADPDDRILPPGNAGEMLLRPREPYLMANGYLHDDAATVVAWRNLWFHTGDRVVCDGEGVYRFLDRTRDAIRRRGENVSSFEVERALLEHEAVVRAAVVGVPSDVGDEDVLAYVEVRPGMDVEFVELVRFLEPRLPYFAVPRYLVRREALPTTENGKVRKFALKASGIPIDAWDRDRVGIEVTR